VSKLGLSFRFRRLLGSRLFVPFRSTRGSFFLLVWTKGDPFSSPGSILLPGFVPIGWCLTTSPDDGRGGFVPIHAPERSTPGWNSVGRMRPWSFLRNDARAGTFQVDSPQPQLCRSRETNGACPLAGDPIHSIGEDRTISSTRLSRTCACTSPRDPFTMPVVSSYAFVNNRGGTGKSFCLFQVATAYAKANPDKKVLVLDCSAHGDVSQYLLGGTQEPLEREPTASTAGSQKLKTIPVE